MQPERLPHERLFVYKKSLDFMVSAQSMITSWSNQHAVGDELDRASESIVLNLAEAVSLRSAEARLATLDYALGSACECAACLDLALIKNLIPCDQSFQEKANLSALVRMLHGLRQEWEQELKDEPPAAQTPEREGTVSNFFAHEKLDAYQNGLDFVRWFTQCTAHADLPLAIWRQVDKAGTALVLNIAEGNGRLSKSEHGRFLRLALQAGVRAGAYLDLIKIRAILVPEDVETGAKFLRSAVWLVRGLTRYLDGCDSMEVPEAS